MKFNDFVAIIFRRNNRVILTIEIVINKKGGECKISFSRNVSIISVFAGCYSRCLFQPEINAFYVIRVLNAMPVHSDTNFHPLIIVTYN